MQSKDNLRNTIDAVADQQEQRKRRVAVYAQLARSGELHIDGIDPAYRDALKYLASRSGVEMTPQQFHAKQEAERPRCFGASPDPSRPRCFAPTSGPPLSCRRSQLLRRQPLRRTRACHVPARCLIDAIRLPFGTSVGQEQIF